MKRLRILIVDDEPNILDVTSRRLQREGHETTTVIDAEWGVALSRASRFDAILMDIDLPGMSGLQAIKQFASSSKAPIILMTAHSDPKLTQQALTQGAKALLFKPLDLNNLKELLAGLPRP